MNSDIQRIINEIKLSAEEIVSESPDQIKAVYVMDREGTVIAYTTNATLASTGDMFFAMPRFISSLKGLLTTLPIGKIDYILIQGIEGIVQLMGIREIGYLMVIVNSESSIGLTRIILERYTNKLYELLSKLTGASEEQLVEVVNVEITPKDIEDVINFIRSKAMF
ncbi:hypothetical protein [Vulcanisaeta souniana]|uniref:Roadblock/LAMTOR2 domain-containing protein n=2 Tax=Vulcanisaeta souniana TaxID=164452 RepID=A0A830DZ18_9CREN|nr:hypothetical protein [Vulcanisaeta souniana]BDR91761.1 hypothetical protein Vsou_08540 [Vulcanisaeta souniana JCM 11219]GGI70590.1 hypothetical protein GCM10007112_04430 [Vulcanisaeta souniana JCM 11219]